MPLYAHRPPWLQTHIDGIYAYEHGRLPDLEFGIRGACGTNRTYDIDGHDTGMLADGLRKTPNTSLSILDVGTGFGGPVLHHLALGDTAQGITAFDFRAINMRHPFIGNNEAYITGNAENMYALQGLHAAYDMVMSNLTMDHFVDPLGTLEQMANKVAPGGLLAVDGFNFCPIPDDCPVSGATIVGAMNEQGFALLHQRVFTPETLAIGALPAAVWRRASDAARPVEFPVNYAQAEESHLIYARA